VGVPPITVGLPAREGFSGFFIPRREPAVLRMRRYRIARRPMIAIETIRRNNPDGMLTFGRSAAFFAIWIREVRFSRTVSGLGCTVTRATGGAAL
jgi:hypothetical protein